MRNKKYKLAIIDEAHRSFSPKFRELYELLETEYLLLLTATVPEDPERLEMMKQTAPILLEKSPDQAVEDQAVSPVEVINYAVGMDKKSSLRYTTFDRKFKGAVRDLSIACRKSNKCQSLPSIFEVARKYSKEYDEILSKPSKEYWSAMTMRKYSLYGNDAKIPAVLEILRKYPDRKWIILHKSIDAAEKLHRLIPGSRVYHSKMSSEEREKSLVTIRSGKSKILIGADALIEGLDIPDLDGGICVAGSSTVLSFIQSIGRISRIKENKKALFFNIYAKNSQEEKWVTKKLQNKNSKWITDLKDI